MSSLHALLISSELLIRLLAHPPAILTELHPPQIWIYTTFSTANRLLRHHQKEESRLILPTYLTITLYAASEPLWYLVSLRMLQYVPDPSWAVSTGAVMHMLVAISFALPDDLDAPAASPWQSSGVFVYAMNMLVIQSAAVQNAGWALLAQSLAVSPLEQWGRGLTAVFAAIGISVSMGAWWLCWIGFVGLNPWTDVVEYCSRLRKDVSLRRRVLCNLALLLVLRIVARMALGLSPILLLPISGRREVARGIWARIEKFNDGS